MENMILFYYAFYNLLESIVVKSVTNTFMYIIITSSTIYRVSHTHNCSELTFNNRFFRVMIIFKSRIIKGKDSLSKISLGENELYNHE